MTSKILIITADAGFGHRRASQALELALSRASKGQCQVTIINPIQDPAIPEMIKQLENGYDDVVLDDPSLYQLAYSATDAPVVAQLIQEVTTTVLNKTLMSTVEEYTPDAILGTYGTYTQAAIRAVRKVMPRPIPVDLVITDLVDVHSTWFHKDVDVTFVPTGNVYKQSLDFGLDKTRVHLTGLPVDPDFADETRDKRSLRIALGWDPDVPTALIIGSTRTRETAAVARLLDRSGLNIQIAVIAGGNLETQEELHAISWRGKAHVYGLVKNVPELMRAADFVVCKAGGLVIAEALACGLPLILCEALPGQEAGNVRYVVDSGAGVWSPGPIGVLTTAYSWLAGDQAEMEKCALIAQQLGKPRAAYDIAERLFKQIEAS